MVTCTHCGSGFDVDKARSAVTAEYDGDIDYDEEMDGEVCGDCSISKFDSNMNLGRAIMMMNGDEDYDEDHVEKYL
jgi:hypothetical protein